MKRQLEKLGNYRYEPDSNLDGCDESSSLLRANKKIKTSFQDKTLNLDSYGIDKPIEETASR